MAIPERTAWGETNLDVVKNQRSSWTSHIHLHLHSFTFTFIYIYIHLHYIYPRLHSLTFIYMSPVATGHQSARRLIWLWGFALNLWTPWWPDAAFSKNSLNDGIWKTPNPQSYGHLPVISGYFYGIIHSINGVISKYLELINGHNCKITIFPS